MKNESKSCVLSHVPVVGDMTTCNIKTWKKWIIAEKKVNYCIIATYENESLNSLLWIPSAVSLIMTFWSLQHYIENKVSRLKPRVFHFHLSHMNFLWNNYLFSIGPTFFPL